MYFLHIKCLCLKFFYIFLSIILFIWLKGNGLGFKRAKCRYINGLYVYLWAALYVYLWAARGPGEQASMANY